MEYKGNWGNLYNSEYFLGYSYSSRINKRLLWNFKVLLGIVSVNTTTQSFTIQRGLGSSIEVYKYPSVYGDGFGYGISTGFGYRISVHFTILFDISFSNSEINFAAIQNYFPAYSSSFYIEKATVGLGYSF